MSEVKIAGQSVYIVYSVLCIWREGGAPSFVYKFCVTPLLFFFLSRGRCRCTRVSDGSGTATTAVGCCYGLRASPRDWVTFGQAFLGDHPGQPAISDNAEAFGVGYGLPAYYAESGQSRLGRSVRRGW